MKKSHIVGGIVVLGAALIFVVYINTKSPKGTTGPEPVAVSGDVNSPDYDAGTVRPSFDGGNFAPVDSAGNPNGDPVAAAQDPKMAKIDAFVASSRIADEFKFLDEQMEIQYERMKLTAAPEELATFEELRNQLKGDELLAKYKEVLKANFSDADLDHLSAIQQNPAYAKFKEAEAYNRSPQGMKELADFSKNFKQENLPPQRLAALKEFVEASGAAENMKGMLKSVESLFGGAPGKANKKEVKAYEDILMKSINDAMILTHAKNFDGQPDDAIREQAKIVGDPVVRRADQTKVGFIADTMVEKIQPKLEEAMAGSAAGR